MSKPKAAGFVLLLFTAGVLGVAYLFWDRYGPSSHTLAGPEYSWYPEVRLIIPDRSECALEVKRYRQIGTEIQLLLYAVKPGLGPFAAMLTQGDTTLFLPEIPSRNSSWLSLGDLDFEHGEVSVALQSLSVPDCATTISFRYDTALKNEIADPSGWLRHGSGDHMLDVRVVASGGKLYLRDFAGYRDSRTRTYQVDGIVVNDLEKGIEVRPGYLYSVTARWIDAPYADWWNRLKNRTTRQQAVWIAPSGEGRTTADPGSVLSPVRIPEWFRPSGTFSPSFDTLFPEFSPVRGKLVMQYRLNSDIPADQYFRRGITHLPRWEKEIPGEKQHWTEPPGFFGDRTQEWFAGLSKAEVEAYADQIGNIGVYAFDFEFWRRAYAPAVRQRLIWYARRIRENSPQTYLFDYWGGAAYTNHNFEAGGIRPQAFVKDYLYPRANHFNFEKAADGDFFGNYFNVSPVDVYPRPFHSPDAQGNTANNYLVLSGVHASRINRLIPYQRNNKVIWYAWNRHMPLYGDPTVPWEVRTTDPRGILAFQELEMMPASQALSISLFSLITADGYYLWNDSQPRGRGNNNYHPYAYTPETFEWYPDDGKAGVELFSRRASGPESPRYWDYPTEFYMLGNWMARQVEDILEGGTSADLPYKVGDTWRIPGKEQVLQSAYFKEPFVTAVTKHGQITVLALDAFQLPYAERKLLIRLPDGTETTIKLYGNWPALYRGTLKRTK